MSKYTVVVSDHFGVEAEEFSFDTRKEVFNFVTVTDCPVAIWKDGKEDNPTETEAWDDWLDRKD